MRVYLGNEHISQANIKLLNYINGIDMSKDTVKEETLVEGVTAHDKNGNYITGTNPYELTKTNNIVNTQADLIYQIKAALGLIREPKPVFSDNSWEDIIWACQNNAVPDTWVADGTCSKTMSIGGTDYIIDIIGKNHDTYTAGGIAPITFQFRDCFETTYQMHNSDTNSVGYSNSDMHTIHLPEIKSLMPSEVQSAIKSVDKLSGTGGGSSSVIETVSCDLFLLSEIEVFGSNSYSIAGEGSQYAWYSADNTKVKVLVGGSKKNWWERSPQYSDTGSFCGVISSGSGFASGYPASQLLGVAPAFCF